VALAVAHDGTRLLLFTRSAAPSKERPMVAYGRILDLARLVVWPEMYLESLAGHGQWTALNDPVPADRLLAMAKVEPVR